MESNVFAESSTSSAVNVDLSLSTNSLVASDRGQAAARSTLDASSATPVSLICTFLSRIGYLGDGCTIIPISLLDRQDELGSGGQATVFLGTWRQESGVRMETRTARPVALKYYKFDISTDDEAEADGVTRSSLKSLLRELRVMASPMAHRENNLIQVFGISFEEISRYGMALYRPIVVVERAWKSLTAFVEDGDLDSNVFDRHQVEESLVYGLLRALDFLHLQGIVHGDLKPDNVLMFREGSLSGRERAIGRLSDFGLTDIMIHQQSEERPATLEAVQAGLETLPLEELPRAGTEYWRAPETYGNSEYSRMGKDYPFSRDFYALGLVTYYVLFQSRLPSVALSSLPEEQNKRAVKQAVEAAFTGRWRFRWSRSVGPGQLVECPSSAARVAKFSEWRKAGEVLEEERRNSQEWTRIDGITYHHVFKEFMHHSLLRHPKARLRNVLLAVTARFGEQEPGVADAIEQLAISNFVGRENFSLGGVVDDQKLHDLVESRKTTYFERCRNLELQDMDLQPHPVGSPTARDLSDLRIASYQFKTQALAALPEGLRKAMLQDLERRLDSGQLSHKDELAILYKLADRDLDLSGDCRKAMLGDLLDKMQYLIGKLSRLEPFDAEVEHLMPTWVAQIYCSQMPEGKVHEPTMEMIQHIPPDIRLQAAVDSLNDLVEELCIDWPLEDVPPDVSALPAFQAVIDEDIAALAEILRAEETPTPEFNGLSLLHFAIQQRKSAVARALVLDHGFFPLEQSQAGKDAIKLCLEADDTHTLYNIVIATEILCYQAGLSRADTGTLNIMYFPVIEAMSAANLQLAVEIGSMFWFCSLSMFHERCKNQTSLWRLANPGVDNMDQAYAPLFAAIENRRPHALEALLRLSGLPVNHFNANDDRSLLLTAIETFNPWAVAILLARGADPNLASPGQERRPLAFAIACNGLAYVRSKKKTRMFYAGRGALPSLRRMIVLLLLAKGADFRERADGSLRNMCIACGRDEVLDCFPV